MIISKRSKNKKKVELLAPAGNLSKLKYAILYGADAVYCGVPAWSLRVRINQFTEDDLKEAIEFVHERGKKIYVTLNIYAHNMHLPEIKKHLVFLGRLGKLGFIVDGVIVSDPGIINLVKKHLPGVDIHLSTQANATNYEAVKFWKEQGVKRVILARELSLGEVREVREKVKGVELETFVHGAMCMSYSGRCILSKWMTNRSANLGDCSQPCRWRYKAVSSKRQAISEKQKMLGELKVIDDQGRYEMDVEEDRHGTYFFNSYDMNFIEHVPELIDAGISSLKIEGRAKSAYYLAVVVRAYRKMIDAVGTADLLSLRKIIEEQKKELDKLTHRGYTKGFLLGEEPQHNISGKLQGGEWEFVGEIESFGEVRDVGVVRVHNEVFLNDKIEAVTPDGNIPVKIRKIFDHNKKEVTEAHGGHAKRYYFQFDSGVVLPPGSLLRRKVAIRKKK